ncbi:MAG: transporter substrate-binding domain-containing protein [Coriobacteriales bacterium]|nr:transporter substrate-binding domain-containing protein [Coriobacteriales bacterium]
MKNLKNLQNYRKFLALITCMLLAMSLMLSACGDNSAKPTDSNTNSTDTVASGTTPIASAEMKLVTAGTLTVGSDCDYPPFISLDGATPAGFEYELMQAVADEMGLKLKYLEPQNFDTILASVAAGTKLDLGVSSFTITDERKELVDFCIPYCDSNQACVALKDKGFKSASDLEGKVVGAQSGTTGESWALENVPGITMKPFNQTSEGLAALMSGDIEALFFDEPVAAWQIKNTYTDAETIEKIPTGEQYGFAVAKTNPVLKDKINEALAALKQNGTFDKLYDKYFPGVTAPSLKG